MCSRSADDFNDKHFGTKLRRLDRQHATPEHEDTEVD
jgi:hypothetical protein